MCSALLYANSASLGSSCQTPRAYCNVKATIKVRMKTSVVWFYTHLIEIQTMDPVSMALMKNDLLMNDVSAEIAKRYVKYLEGMLALRLGVNISLNLYGSIATGLATEGSDIDISVNIEGGQAVTLDDIYRCIRAWRRNGILHLRNLFLIGRARVPLIRYQQRMTTPEDYKDVDITFENEHGLKNSELLKKYFDASSILKNSVTLLKCIFDTQNFAPGIKLTNYALTVLCIFYMQRESIVPIFKYDDETDSIYRSFQKLDVSRSRFHIFAGLLHFLLECFDTCNANEQKIVDIYDRDMAPSTLLHSDFFGCDLVVVDPLNKSNITRIHMQDSLRRYYNICSSILNSVTEAVFIEGETPSELSYLYKYIVERL